MHKFIFVLAALCLWCMPLVQAQSDLTVEMMYDLSPNFTNQGSVLQGVLVDNDTVYVFTQLAPELFSFKISDVTANLQPGKLKFNHTVIDPNSFVQVNTGFLDTKTKNVYIGGATSIYRVNTTHWTSDSIQLDGDSSFNSQTSFVDVETRKGYFVSNSNTPGRIIVLPLDKFNASLIEYIYTQSENVYSSSYDPITKLAYLVSFDGNLEIVNVTANTTKMFSNSSGTEYKFKSVIYDSTHKLIYTCADNSSEPEVSVYDQNFNFISDFPLPSGMTGDDCTTGVLDLGRGQGFFSFFDSSAALLVSIVLPERNAPATYTPVLSDFPQMIGSYVYPADRSLFLISNRQIILVSYTSSCPNDCSNHGTCDYANCTCDVGWYGNDCSSPRCLNDCSFQGTCSGGLCACYANYTAADCSIRQCTNNCSRHGICSQNPDYYCTCQDGWTGVDCSVAPPAPPPPQCYTLDGYKSCVAHQYCGWCGDIRSGHCMEGNIEGPVDGACIEWNYHQNPEIGVIIIAIVFIVVLGLMFLNNMFSALRMDWKRAADLQSEYSTGVVRKPTMAEAASLWWRDQRSAKAWTLFEQFQFFALFTHFAMSYPTRILSLVRFLLWTNLGLPLPFMDDHTIHDNRRTLLGIVQYGNGLGILPQDIYSANMFWFAMGIFAIVVLVGGLAVVLWFKTHWRTVLACRLVYLLTRFVSLAYMGIMMTSSYVMVASPHLARHIVPALFTFLIIGIGFPYFVHKLLDGKTKRLFENEFKFKYGWLYVNYRPEHSKFYLINISRRAITGMLVGFLGFSALNSPKWVVWFQVVTLVIVQIAYAFRVWKAKPYYDQYHEYLDYFLCIVNIGTVALSMLHYNEPSIAGELITALIQALGFVACVGVYIISWMQMSSKLFRRFFEMCCCCCSKKRDVDGNVPLENVTQEGGGTDI